MKPFISAGILSIFMFVTCISSAQTGLSQEDREKAINHLKKTQADLKAAVEGLTEEQLNYKADENSWSVANCVEHIAISEQMIFGMLEKALESEADPSKHGDVAMSDEQLVGIIEDRSQKIKTSEPFEPKENFGSYQGSLDTFNQRRDSNIGFLEYADNNLRDYYTQLPFGTIDGVQILLFMSGHTARHIKQIEEVKNSAGFPD